MARPIRPSFLSPSPQPLFLPRPSCHISPKHRYSTSYLTSRLQPQHTRSGRHCYDVSRRRRLNTSCKQAHALTVTRRASSFIQNHRTTDGAQAAPHPRNITGHNQDHGLRASPSADSAIATLSCVRSFDM
ncbi:hypothetical protein NUW54_g13312 [Trametes sanguinea]|uniref:Uncharacterized protein n=1 Tax=Trametes sanguinea TaxID=158606 RepID=A0ACC1MPB9_9APHY|nr:hypothetical protein NUW54_g13312 [Trametes sanguinea]